MNIEPINSRKNWVTIVAFIVIGIALNFSSFAELFGFEISYQVKKYLNFTPFIFIGFVLLQRKNTSIEITTPLLWKVPKKSNFFLNKRRVIYRYIIIGIAILSFFASNIYSSTGGFTSQNLNIIIPFFIAISVFLAYSYFRKNFQVGICDKGVVYGYPSKLMLIQWNSIKDFEINDDKQEAWIHLNNKLSISKIRLNKTDKYAEIKSLLIEHLEYKNVSKLLIDEH